MQGMGGGDIRSWEVVEGMKPAMGMVMIQIVFAGVNVFYKLAINDGMDLRILVAYRYLFATASLGPLAFFLERKIRPRITWKILMQAFFCGLFGGALAQNLYISSLKLTSATFASAMTNLIPAITFIMAVMFRLENFGIRTWSGKAKILGTLLGIGGAMILTFFKGRELNFSTSVDLLKAESNGGNQKDGAHQESGNRVAGSLLALSSCFSYSIWLIIQAKMIKAYPCHYSSAALMCLMGAIQGVIFALCMERNWEQWHMGLGIRLYSTVYSKKGPLYASVFNPLMLVIVAIFGALLLNEKIHIGSVIGAILIVIGLYFVLWGKGKEGEATKLGKFIIERDTIDVVVNSRRTMLLNGSVFPSGGAELQQRETLES